MSGSSLHWEHRGDREVLDGRVFKVVQRRLYHPGRETEADFSVIVSLPWVNVLALTTEGEVVMVRQFRYGTQQLSLEPPGGMFEPDESPVEAGLRELREETGFTGERARLIGEVQPNPAILNNHCYFVLVEDAVRTESTDWDEHEEIEVVTMPWRDAVEAARTGGVIHSLGVCALFFLEQALREKSDL